MSCQLGVSDINCNETLTHTNMHIPVKCSAQTDRDVHVNLYTGSAKELFFGICFKKNLLNISSNFFFYSIKQFFRLIMENNIISMAASAGHAIAYTIGPIFKHIIDCVQLYFTNGLTNIVL